MEVKTTGGRMSSSLTLNARTGKRRFTMAVTITTRDGICMVAIHCEEDLKLAPKFKQINPPPADGRCECCGKHLNELKPFSVVGHPWEVDVEDVLLVKCSRPSAPPDERVDRIMKEFFGGCLSDEDEEKAEERLNEVYGHEMAEYLLRYSAAAGQISASWECYDCMGLDTEAYSEISPYRFSQYSGDYNLNHEEVTQMLATCPYCQFAKRRLIRQEQTSL
jgi:hypothetical protein